MAAVLWVGFYYASKMGSDRGASEVWSREERDILEGKRSPRVRRRVSLRTFFVGLARKNRTLLASLAAWLVAVVVWVFLAYSLDQGNSTLGSLPVWLLDGMWFAAASLSWGLYGTMLAKWAGWGCRPWVSGIGLGLGATLANLGIFFASNRLPMQNWPPLTEEHLPAAAAWVAIGMVCGMVWGLFLARDRRRGHLSVLGTTTLLGLIFPLSWLIGFAFGFYHNSGVEVFIAFGGFGAAMFGLAADWLRRLEVGKESQVA